MSKSKGNAVSPDDIIDEHGADSLRAYIMFVAPFCDDLQWTNEGMTGAARFVARVWRWGENVTKSFDPEWRDSPSLKDPAARAVRGKLHQTIKKVGEDIAAFAHNTAVAALMELTNAVYQYAPLGAVPNRAVVSEILEHLVLILAPVTPFIAEELWERMGRQGFVCQQRWPAFDPAIAARTEVTVAVQVNGKTREKIVVPVDLTQDEVHAAAMKSASVRRALQDRAIAKVILVANRLINLVTD